MGIVGCMHMDNLRRIFALIGVSHPNREKLNFKSSFREESKNTAHTAGRTWSALSMDMSQECNYGTCQKLPYAVKRDAYLILSASCIKFFSAVFLGETQLPGWT
jgi:hypothetical protein